MSVAYSQQQQSQQPPNSGNQGDPAEPMQRRGPPPPPPSPLYTQKILDENAGLIQTIQDFQTVGKASECLSYHVALHRNLLYLAKLADQQPAGATTGPLFGHEPDEPAHPGQPGQSPDPNQPATTVGSGAPPQSPPSEQQQQHSV